ncbi:MAG: DNRLRE domain-containing protein [Acidobacteria bacterium]|nr:DNRLRE domain-containing protein [Acidobacteriota bacterium]
MCRGLLVGALLLGGITPDAAVAQTATVTFRPGPGANDGSDEGGASGGKDTWDWRTDNPAHSNVNTGANTVLALWNSNCNGWQARSYLQFDVSSLPAAELVTSVKLLLYTKIGGIYGAEPPSSTMVVQAVLAPWNEMTLTYNTAPPVSPTVEASVTLATAGNPGFQGFADLDITELYKDWRDGTRPNYGMRYSRSNLACENGNYNYTTSSDDADDTRRPALVVTYLDEPEDTTPPDIAVPDAVTAEATSPGGAAVSYLVSANDGVDGPVAVACEPASGSSFPLGQTEVRCTATDAAGNAADSFFDVFVVDTRPPIPILPGDMTAPATGAAGATVTFSATATDIVDTDVTVTCVPASGSIFPIGTTTVSCTAEDDSGNSAMGPFLVSVVVNAGTLEALIRSWVSNAGVANSLVVKLRNGAYGAFRNELAALSGRWLTPGQASDLALLSLYL